MAAGALQGVQIIDVPAKHLLLLLILLLWFLKLTGFNLIIIIERKINHLTILTVAIGLTGV